MSRESKAFGQEVVAVEPLSEVDYRAFVTRRLRVADGWVVTCSLVGPGVATVSSCFVPDGSCRWALDEHAKSLRGMANGSR